MRRRDFLMGATLAAAGHRALRASANAGFQPEPQRLPDVVQVSSEFVVRGRLVHPVILGEMLDMALSRLCGTKSSEQAWHSLLRNDDVIGLKFNSSGAKGLGVSEPFAEALIKSLGNAGFGAEKIIAIEAGTLTYKQFSVQHPKPGWDAEPTRFASGEDRLASVLNDVSAIINVPFLKNHNIAGITCCLKNLSHGLVKHPARFHENHCSPFIADIVALPQIRSKLRLNLVNGLRVVYDGGPESNDSATWDGGIILAGKDPVACDTVGLELINSQRYVMGLPGVDNDNKLTLHLDAAAERGLGVANPYRMEIVRARV